MAKSSHWEGDWKHDGLSHIGEGTPRQNLGSAGKGERGGRLGGWQPTVFISASAPQSGQGDVTAFRRRPVFFFLWARTALSPVPIAGAIERVCPGMLLGLEGRNPRW